VPRKSRNEDRGAAHHGFPRGNNREDIFRDDGDRQFFLTALIGVVEAYGWEVYAYCLMRNHFHIVVRTPVPNFGEGMQRLLSAYARHFKRRYRRDGHVFKRPFKSEPIKAERQLETAINYVAGNPVRAGICATDDEWPWSSHGGCPCIYRQAIMGAAGG
jgi:REP element-mobilizing transposase RayT